MTIAVTPLHNFFAPRLTDLPAVVASLPGAPYCGSQLESISNRNYDESRRLSDAEPSGDRTGGQAAGTRPTHGGTRNG
jgi:hypothetical protein